MQQRRQKGSLVLNFNQYTHSPQTIKSKMFTKLICIAALAISCVCAKPGLAVAPAAYGAYSAPVVAAAGPAFVTAQSSQVVARNYNGIAPLAYTAAPVAAPLAYAPAVAKVAAPVAYAAGPAPLAYTAPIAPVARAFAAAPYAAAPFGVAPYAAAPFAAAPYVASPYAAYRYNPYLL